MDRKLRAGDTFLFPLRATGTTAHLWVVATEPDAEGRFVAVNFTSLRGARDQTVIVRAREHEFVNHDTCVYYAAAELTDSAKVITRIETGDAQMRAPVSDSLLQLILAGFSASDFTRKRILEFVREYRSGTRLRRAAEPG